MKRIVFALFMLVSFQLALATPPQYSDFTKVSYSLPFSVEITISDQFSVELDAPDDVKEKIVIEQKDNELSLRWKDKKGWGSGYSYKKEDAMRQKVKLRISMPTLEALNLAGSGDVTVKNSFETTNFACNLSGSGDVRIESVKAENVQFNIAGSGDIVVSGTASKAGFNVAGSGDIEAKNLKAQNVECNVAGSGDISCYANTSLSASVMGSGDISYSGDAQNVNKSVKGSGSVTKR